MATTADIKIGACIELEGKTFQIVDFQHVKPGKGPAFRAHEAQACTDCP